MAQLLEFGANNQNRQRNKTATRIRRQAGFLRMCHTTMNIQIVMVCPATLQQDFCKIAKQENDTAFGHLTSTGHPGFNGNMTPSSIISVNCQNPLKEDWAEVQVDSK